MKAVLLAAGQSRRMKPVEDKNFLSFLGKYLIQHQLEMIKEAGFKDIVIVAGKHNHARLAALDKKIAIVEQEGFGMDRAILAAKKKIGNEPFLLFGSNDVVGIEALKLIKKTVQSGGAESFVLATRVVGYFPGGYLEVERGFIKNIVEKPEPGKEPSDLVNLVVHFHKNLPSLIKYIEKVKGNRDDRYEVALSMMAHDGIKMKAIPYNGFWQPIKYPRHIQNVFSYFFEKAKKRISKSARISKNAMINGDVIIEDGVKILDGAVINGPCYIGRGSVIATNALVRDSHIGAECVIGFGSEVARSYLGDFVWTHTNYIGDSVIGNNVAFGAGAVTGNLRLDEGNIIVECDGKKIDCGSNKFGAVIGNDVRIGVNTSLMPGVKIGAGSFVGAGIVVAENIPAKSFVRGNFKLKISENKFDTSKLRRDAKTFNNDR